jgi:arylsulfatase A-like enzyme
LADKKQYIDGVNNLPYWKGEAKESARSHIYHEAKLSAARVDQWKFHFSTKEDYYADFVPRTMPLLFNLRLDPFEQYASKDSYSHLAQWVSRLMQPLGEMMKDPLRTLAEYPPVQGSKSFHMSNIVEPFLK